MTKERSGAAFSRWRNPDTIFPAPIGTRGEKKNFVTPEEWASQTSIMVGVRRIAL